MDRFIALFITMYFFWDVQLYGMLGRVECWKLIKNDWIRYDVLLANAKRGRVANSPHPRTFRVHHKKENCWLLQLSRRSNQHQDRHWSEKRARKILHLTTVFWMGDELGSSLKIKEQIQIEHRTEMMCV